MCEFRTSSALVAAAVASKIIVLCVLRLPASTDDRRRMNDDVCATTDSRAFTGQSARQTRLSTGTALSRPVV
jgi:hypothetical protein